MTVEILEYDAIPPDLADAWREDGAAADPAMALARSPEWFTMMVDAGFPGEVAVLRDRQGVATAVLPMLETDWTIAYRIAGRSFGSRRCRAARICGGDLVGRTLDPERASVFLAEVMSRRPTLDAFVFDHVREGAASDRLRAIGRGRGAMVLVLSQGLPHYRLALPPNRDALHAMRSPKSLKKIRGRERAMARHAGDDCRLLEIRGEADWEPHAADIERVMQGRWQARVLRHTFRIEDLRSAAHHGVLRGFVLLAGERVTAVALCYQGRGSLIYDQIGYDQEFAKFSPGTILLYRLLDRLYDADTPRYVDFGEGEGAYKESLANDRIEVNSFLVVRQSASMRCSAATYRATRRIDRMVRWAARQLPAGRNAIRRRKR